MVFLSLVYLGKSLKRMPVSRQLCLEKKVVVKTSVFVLQLLFFKCQLISFFTKKSIADEVLSRKSFCSQAWEQERR